MVRNSQPCALLGLGGINIIFCSRDFTYSVTSRLQIIFFSLCRMMISNED